MAASGVCDFCGLPLSDGEPVRDGVRGLAGGELTDSHRGRDSHLLAGGRRAVADAPRYCCQGCRFAASVTQASGEAGRMRGLMIRLGLSLFFSMNVMAFTMYLWTQDEALDTAESGQRAAAVF